jgi:hypothetical protein
LSKFNTHYFHVVEFTIEFEARSLLQKIEHLRKHTTRRHKSIHNAIEVKTFFSDSTPMTDTSTESSTQSLHFPLTAVVGLTGIERKRERERYLHTTIKAKLERLRSARLTRHDQAV